MPSGQPQKLEVPEDQEFVEGILVENEAEHESASKKQQSMKQLEEVFSTPRKKNDSLQEESDSLNKHHSSNGKFSNPSFDNQKKKDKYNALPDNINLSPNSSNEEELPAQKKDGLNFDLFGIFGNKAGSAKVVDDLYDESKPYDDLPFTHQKKQASEPSNFQMATILQGIDLMETSAPIPEVSLKPVKAVDYSKYAIQSSPSSDKDIDEHQILQIKQQFHDLQ